MDAPTLPRVLRHAKRVHGPGPAAVIGAETHSYDRVAGRVAARARGLREEGIGVGDRVGCLASNGLPFLEATFAAAELGAVLVPLNVRLRPEDLGFALDDAGARALWFDQAHAELAVGALRQAAIECAPVALPDHPGESGLESPAERQPDETCHLYYTSGTTGGAKGVALTHRNITTHALAACAELSLTSADTWAHVAPMFHLADAWATIAITWVGGRHVFLPRFEAEAALDLFERERVTISNLVPTMLNLMVKHPSASGRDVSALRRVLSGGAPIAPEVVRAIEGTFRAEYVQTYGMTETSPYLTMSLLSAWERELPEDQRFARRARTGRPFMGVELEVVDVAGEPVPRDDETVGEIRVRGATVTRGYWNRPEETAAAIRDGWLHTGDLARWDEHGSVQIVDRRKDVILSGGENVYSTEVEAVLYEHPDVLEAAAYGEPDETWGEVVCAAVVPRDGVQLTADALDAFCRERLAGFKRPRRVRILDALPRTGSGKIAKRLLRESSG